MSSEGNHSDSNTADHQRFNTRCVHAGQEPDPYSGAVMVPISMSSTFAQHGVGKLYPGKFEYSRSGNPTRETFEKLVASLENGKFGLAFSSGLGTATCVANLLKSGDHVICMDDVYGGTGRLFRVLQKTMGIKVSMIDLNDEALLEKSITAETRMIWIETPTNPTLKIVDIRKTTENVRKRGNGKDIILVVDNTFMSPYFQNPLDLGADIVIHSVTKYLNGHSDVVMGCAMLNDQKLYQELQFLQNSLGVVPSPFDCFLAIRGVKTLHLRMKEAAHNAQAIAEFLEKSEKVDHVTYPGLKSHPQYEIGKKQTRGSGGMITCYLKGGITQSQQFLEPLKIFTLAESLGGVESLIECPSLMTHASVPQELREKLGIKDNLIRISVGVEDAHDLIMDIKRALDNIKN